MEKRTLTPKELQSFIGIGRAKAYELCNKKGFPAFRVGKKILINTEGLQRWMTEQEGKQNGD